ncbi:MAG: ATP-binding protein [Chitinispirillaceae bacterium]|nr:ATP-binding protein [Chitinispirillaceae bacterium]
MRVPRTVAIDIKKSLTEIPVTALLGPRQCGKTTLVKMLLPEDSSLMYLDLERPDDKRLLSDPQSFFRLHRDRLLCLDEIQRAPEIFSVMRAEVDEAEVNGRFLILGSASPRLLRQTSETLAGRIHYIEMAPFSLSEVDMEGKNMRILWMRGGFPRSYLAATDEASYEWRQDFIRTFLERDIPAMGFRIPENSMRRFWRMLAHLNAQVLNRSKIGQSLGTSHHTVQHHLDILIDSYMVRSLEPLEVNVKKRLVKSPKIYIRDTGIVHALSGIGTLRDCMSHPDYGSSWESFALENICSHPHVKKRWQFYFYSVHSGGEIDLVLDDGRERVAVEFKVSSAPDVPENFLSALKDTGITSAWIVAPVERSYPAGNGVMVGTPEDFLQFILKKC